MPVPAHPMLLLAAAALFAATALAPMSSARAEPPASPEADATFYAFEDDDIVGDTTRPLGEILRVRPRPQRQSLVRARSSFVPELLSSVEAL